MPQLIGDCIMTFPLINQLKLKHDITIVCNAYVYDLIKYLQHSLKSQLLTDNEFNGEIIIDFLSNETSADYIRLSKPKITVGFMDGVWKYDLILKQPAEFKSFQASSIFLQALELLGLNSNNSLDFSNSHSWQFSNQSKILITPSAGNISRCYTIEEYVQLAENLYNKNIAFLLGPNDKNIRNSIPYEFETIESSNIAETIDILASAKMIVSSEGGLMHIAASYGIPLLGLFKVASVSNWFPYHNKYQIAIGEGKNNYNEMTGAKMDVILVTKKVKEIYESI